jgi:hypothetical protein
MSTYENTSSCGSSTYIGNPEENTTFMYAVCQQGWTRHLKITGPGPQENFSKMNLKMAESRVRSRHINTAEIRDMSEAGL